MRRRIFRQTTRRLGASLTVRLGAPRPGAIGHYDRRAREIVISPALSHAGRIVVLVHELLHAVDEQIVASGETRHELPHEWITAAAPQLVAALSALGVRVPAWRTMRRFFEGLEHDTNAELRSVG